MPEVGENEAVWTAGWDWSHRGDEWSKWWGGTEAMWYGVLLPRIHAFVPTSTILEIAPGYGRWTQYLKDLTPHLAIVDLAPNCIEYCQERFADAKNIDYHVNDGRSLDMIADASVNFAFSFDSLVHVEIDVLAAYLEQLSKKLAPDGVGFFHHSNIGAYRALRPLSHRTPRRFLRRLVDKGALLDLYAWRAESVTAEAFARECERVGLVCVAQEKISWENGRFLIDALSVFTRRGSKWDRPQAVGHTRLMRVDAERLSKLYARTSFPGMAAKQEQGGR